MASRENYIFLQNFQPSQPYLEEYEGHHVGHRLLDIVRYSLHTGEGVPARVNDVEELAILLQHQGEAQAGVGHHCQSVSPSPKEEKLNNCSLCTLTNSKDKQHWSVISTIFMQSGYTCHTNNLIELVIIFIISRNSQPI